MKREDVEQFADEITPQTLDRFIEAGVLSGPEQMALGFAAICRAHGAKRVTVEMFKPWEPPLELSPDAFAANLIQRYC